MFYYIIVLLFVSTYIFVRYLIDHSHFILGYINRYINYLRNIL